MMVEVVLAGRRHTVRVQEDADALVMTWGGVRRRVRLAPLVGSEWWRLEVDGRPHDVRIRRQDHALRVAVRDAAAAAAVRRALPVPSRRTAGAAMARAVEVRAPMPGLVVATPIAPGQRVAAGQVVAVVEAMKMQMDVPAPVAGRLAEVRVRPGQEVAGAQVLVVLHADGDGAGDGA
jgi:acetyl-CoA/propionyl-CoA carboxylase biotin carboxyl carrier protein